MLKKYKDFNESKDNNTNVPNNIDNLSQIKGLDKDFKKTNKIEKPEVTTDIDPIELMNYDAFIKRSKEESDELMVNDEIAKNIAKF